MYYILLRTVQLQQVVASVHMTTSRLWVPRPSQEVDATCWRLSPTLRSTYTEVNCAATRTQSHDTRVRGSAIWHDVQPSSNVPISEIQFNFSTRTEKSKLNEARTCSVIHPAKAFQIDNSPLSRQSPFISLSDTVRVPGQESSSTVQYTYTYFKFQLPSPLPGD